MSALARKLLRFAGASGVAAVVVFLLMVGVLWAFGLLDRDDEDVVLAHPVRLLSTTDRVDVAELLEPRRRAPPPPEPAPSFELPAREVSGFVQLAVEVNEEGRVERAEVVNAVPSGIFEEEALRIVRQRRYAVPPDGRAVDEIVPFTVPANGVPQEAETSGLSE